jgi:hypothetical protein
VGDVPWRRRAAPALAAISIASLVAAGATGALTSTACATHACDGSFVNDVRQDPPDSGRYVVGKMVDEDTWESNGLDEPWFDFPGQRTYWFNTPQLLGREPVEMLAYITTVDNPNQSVPRGSPPDNYTLASGNVAEFLDYRGDHFQVKNDTCGHYFVRVVVRVAPVNDAGATPLDAASDAPQDGARE